MSAERDAFLFFNVARIEQAVKDGKFKTIGNSKVPVVDGTQEANKDPKTALTAYVSVPKNPHGVNASPDGKYFICAGKLSPTCSVIDLAMVLDWFDGELKEPSEAIVAEVELGLGPLHTAFDGRGNALHHAVPRQPGRQVERRGRDQVPGRQERQVRGRPHRLQYQPGHLNASSPRRAWRTASGWCVGCKFSKDRFLPAGPLHPENEQLIDISGEKMELLADHPARRSRTTSSSSSATWSSRSRSTRRRLPERGEGPEGKRRRCATGTRSR